MPLTPKVTGDVTLTANGWLRVAQGPGLVTLSTSSYGIRFATTVADEDPAAAVSGHPVSRDAITPMELEAGEFLSVKGRTNDVLQVTADVPMV